MWNDIDLVPGRNRRRSDAGARELTELWVFVAAALVAGILSLFA